MSSSLNNLFLFALEFYRAPLQHQQQLKNYDPTTATFTRFLEIASRPAKSEGLKNIADELHKSPDTLHSASLFLIRQLLFAEKGNHYDILGLARRASQEEIKKRYRALISLFHPDKNPEGEEWSKLYAPDLNEAYNVLKNSSKRSKYDLTLSEPLRDQYRGQYNRPDPAQQTTQARTRTRTTPPLHSYQPSPLESIHRTTLWQKHPHLTIWGTALVILVIIILAVTARSPDHILDVDSAQSGESNIENNRTTTMMGDASSLNQTDDALNFALKETAPRSIETAGRDDSRWDEPRRELGKEEVNALINKYMTEEERFKLSLQQQAKLAAEEAGTEQESPLESGSGYTDSDDSEVIYPDALANYKAGQSQDQNRDKNIEQKRVSNDVLVTAEQTPVASTFQRSSEQPSYHSAPINSAPESINNRNENNSTTQKTPPVTQHTAATKTADTKTTVTKSVQTTPPAPTAVAAEPAAKVASSLSSAATATQPNTPATGKPSSRMANDKVEYLIAQYIAAYDSGNLDQMTRLFTDNVKTDDGIGIAIIKRDYSNLFLNTAERQITVQNVRKVITGERRANIHFDASVRVRNSKSSGWKYFSGGMQLEITDSKNGLQISGLSHSITQDE